MADQLELNLSTEEAQKQIADVITAIEGLDQKLSGFDGADKAAEKLKKLGEVQVSEKPAESIKKINDAATELSKVPVEGTTTKLKELGKVDLNYTQSTLLGLKNTVVDVAKSATNVGELSRALMEQGRTLTSTNSAYNAFRQAIYTTAAAPPALASSVTAMSQTVAGKVGEMSRNLRTSLIESVKNFDLLAKGAELAKGSVMAFIASIGVGSLIEFAKVGFEGAESVERMRVRFENLTGSATKANELLAGQTRIIQQLRAPTDQVREAYTSFGVTLIGSNRTVEQTNNIMAQTFRLLVENRATPREMSQAFNQLNQIFQDGKMQAEGFRGALFDIDPMLRDRIASSLGVAKDRLHEMAAQGKITADVIVKAVSDEANAHQDKLKPALESAGGWFQNLKNFVTSSAESLWLGKEAAEKSGEAHGKAAEGVNKNAEAHGKAAEAAGNNATAQNSLAGALGEVDTGTSKVNGGLTAMDGYYKDVYYDTQNHTNALGQDSRALGDNATQLKQTNDKLNENAKSTAGAVKATSDFINAEGIATTAMRGAQSIISSLIGLWDRLKAAIFGASQAAAQAKVSPPSSSSSSSSYSGPQYSLSDSSSGGGDSSSSSSSSSSSYSDPYTGYADWSNDVPTTNYTGNTTRYGQNSYSQDAVIDSYLGQNGGDGGSSLNDGTSYVDFFSGGGISDVGTSISRAVSDSLFMDAPRFAGGGLSDDPTAIPAVLHPNEAVVPLTGGGAIPVELSGAAPTGGNLDPHAGSKKDDRVVEVLIGIKDEVNHVWEAINTQTSLITNWWTKLLEDVHSIKVDVDTSASSINTLADKLSTLGSSGGGYSGGGSYSGGGGSYSASSGTAANAQSGDLRSQAINDAVALSDQISSIEMNVPHMDGGDFIQPGAIGYTYQGTVYALGYGPVYEARDQANAQESLLITQYIRKYGKDNLIKMFGEEVFNTRTQVWGGGTGNLKLGMITDQYQPASYAVGSPNASKDPTGGFQATLHPDEAVIPLPDGRSVPVSFSDASMERIATSAAEKVMMNQQAPTGGNTVSYQGGAVNIYMTVQTPDADSFRKSDQQLMQELHAKLADTARRAGSKTFIDDPTVRGK